MNEFSGSNCGILSGGAEGHGGVVGKEFDRVGLDYCPRLGQVNVVTTVVIFGTINVPSILSPRSPTLADCRFAVDNYFGARRVKGGGIEVKLAMQLGLGGERRIDARGAE